MPYNSNEEWVEPEHNQIEPVWDEYAAAVYAVEQYGLQLPNNAGRLDAIRNWRKGLCGGPAKNRYAELSSSTREGVIATVEAVRSTLHNAPANANLVLPTMSMVFPKTPRRQATVTRDSQIRNKRKPRDEPSSTSHGEENVYHHEGMPQPDLSLFAAYAPAPISSARPPQHRGYYHPGTYPSNPVPLTRPHDPSAPSPDAYQHARLARTNPAPPETEEQRLMRERHGRDYYGGMNALGRRAARHYGTTPERWALGGAW
ncbi:hypothetical protein JCM10450v2_002300 [Rhodotorula kratochvilovae]